MVSFFTTGHSESIPMKKIVGDINDARLTRDALEGVDVVVHCAALIDVRVKPNVKELQRVNVDGTASFLEACIDRSVSYFIHISTVDVCIGWEQIYFGSEATTPPNKNPILTHYAESKKEAEKLVQSANNRSHTSGMFLLCFLIFLYSFFLLFCPLNFNGSYVSKFHHLYPMRYIT